MNMLSTIIIRSVGGLVIGTGHLRRMGILSRSLRKLGYRTVLYCNSEAQIVHPHVARDFSALVSADTETAFLENIKVESSKNKIAAIIFDDYSIGEDTHKLYRLYSPTLVGIDDLANRKLDCDILIDMNYNRSEVDYTDLISDSTKSYFGPNFQIISERFHDLSQNKTRNFRWPPKHIFISLGGTDPRAYTIKCLKLAHNIFPDSHFDIIVGAQAKNLQHLAAYVKLKHDKTALHISSDKVPELMFRSDLAIGAGGTMTWERNILGLPSIMLLVADNQVQVGAAMKAKRAAIVLDARQNFPETAYLKALRKVSDDRKCLNLLANNAKSMTAGDGANNIALLLHDHIESRFGE